MSTDLLQFLESRIKNRPLPGRGSQLKMAPQPVSKDASLRDMEPAPGASESSVLLLLFPNEHKKYELIITLRSRSIDHGGQLSLPGGRAEAGETPVDTALREAQEEIGINPHDVSVIGQLSKLYVDHSSNLVTPVIGFLKKRPDLTINPDEVEEAFTVALDSLLDKGNLTVEDWELRDRLTYKVPYWDMHRVPLWGATAMMLSEFLELYREFNNRITNNE